MASILLPTTTIAFLLLCLSPIPTTTAFITDIDGEPLVNGGSYYIIPAVTATAGLTVKSGPGSSPCPLYVGQTPNTQGTPVKIYSPVNSRFIPVGVPIEMTFHDIFTICLKPLNWWVIPSNKNDPSYVLVGNTNSFYGFRIEEDNGSAKNNVYNIKYCHPFESEFSSANIVLDCDDIGFVEGGLLGIKPGHPIPVVFQKVTSEIYSV